MCLHQMGMCLDEGGFQIDENYNTEFSDIFEISRNLAYF